MGLVFSTIFLFFGYLFLGVGYANHKIGGYNFNKEIDLWWQRKKEFIDATEDHQLRDSICEQLKDKEWFEEKWNEVVQIIRENATDPEKVLRRATKEWPNQMRYVDDWVAQQSLKRGMITEFEMIKHGKCCFAYTAIFHGCKECCDDIGIMKWAENEFLNHGVYVKIVENVWELDNVWTSKYIPTHDLRPSELRKHNIDF